MGKPTLDQILVSLKNEVLMGRAYLTIAKGLQRADAIILRTSPTFFGLVIDASLQMSQMYAAKLYDQTPGAVTVGTLLKRSLLEANTFSHGTVEQVSFAVVHSKDRIATLKDILASIQKRRHEALAHLDPRTVIDPVGLAARAKLEIPDLERVFTKTSDTLNEIMHLWQDVYADLRFIGDDDFENCLELIAETKHAQVDKWEREFPDKPCPFPRPATPRRQ
jgi:hypothetical protein